jgi:hypothetical protein
MAKMLVRRGSGDHDGQNDVAIFEDIVVIFEGKSGN